MILPFFSGLIQVFGAALISTWIGLSKFGGYLGMFDWDTVWPFFTVLMKILGIAGIVVVVLILVLIPQLEYRHDPKNYFLMVTDYEQYKEIWQRKRLLNKALTYKEEISHEDLSIVCKWFRYQFNDDAQCSKSI